MCFFYCFIVLILIYSFLKYKHTYWTRRGVPQLKPTFVFGNVEQLVRGKLSLNESIRDWYFEFKNQNKIHGGTYLFYKPIWILVDLDLIKQILTTDYDSFSSHGWFHHEKDWITMHIFNLSGEKWKTSRMKLTPTFTSSKMRNMYDLLYVLGDKLEEKVADYCKKGQPIDIKEHTTCFGTDVVATCFFGLDIDCLNNPENEFRKHGKLIFEPRLRKFCLENLFDWDLLGNLGHTFLSQKVCDFFSKVVMDSLEFRKENKVVRNDYLDLLIQLKNEGKMDVKEVISNMVLMYAAGFETSSIATTYLMYELAKNQEIQDKVRQEILKISQRNSKGEITYDDLADMTYTQMCINEIMRLYSPAAVVSRQCQKDYKIPDTDVVIKKGTITLIPAWSIHNDPEYYPNPDKFNPENFSEENRKSRHSFSFLPFGGGPRTCIGSRFGVMQVQVNVIKHLRKYKFKLNPKTPKSCTFISVALTLTAKEDLLLDVTPVEE